MLIPPNNLPTRGFTFERHPDMPQITNVRINGFGFCFDQNGTRLRHASSIMGGEYAWHESNRAFERLDPGAHDRYIAWLNDPENADEVRALDIEAASLLGAHNKAAARGDDLDVEAWIKDRPNPLD